MHGTTEAGKGKAGGGAPDRASPRSSDLRLAVRLALCLFCLYAPFQPGHFQGSDEIGVFETTRALYERGSLDIPPGLHVYRGRGGRLYSHFSIGQSLLALPFFAAGRALRNALPPRPERLIAGPDRVAFGMRYGGTPEIWAVGFYGPVASALLGALFFLFERQLGASRQASLLATALLATSTYVAALSAFFLQHTTETVAILGGLYGLHAYRRSGSLRALALGALSGSAAVLIRVPAAAAAPGLVGYAAWALWARRREEPARFRAAAAAAALLGPALAVLAVHVIVNQAKWGTWIASPFLGQAHAFDYPLLTGLAGFLLSPGCSIFLYSPLLLLVPWLVREGMRRHAPECIAALAIAVSFLLLSAHFDKWTGLWSAPGPRYLFAATPLLLLPLGPWLDRQGRAARWLAVVPLAALGAVIQLLLLLASWPAVIEVMDYRAWEPDKGFVWVASQSPVLGAARALGEGWIAPWLGQLAQGWQGQVARPGVALLLGAAWALALAVALRATRRELHRATGWPAPDGRRPPGAGGPAHCA